MRKTVKNHARSAIGFAALLIFGAGHVLGQTFYDPNNPVSQYPAAAYQEVPGQGNPWAGSPVNPYSPTYTMPSTAMPSTMMPSTSETSVYVANRDMMPVSPTAPGATSNSATWEPTPKPENKFTAYFKNLFGGSKKNDPVGQPTNIPPHQTSQSVAVTPPAKTGYAAPTAPAAPRSAAQQVVHTEEKVSSEGTKTNSGENKSVFSSLWPSSKTKSQSQKDEDVDDGLDFVEMIDQERNFTEKDYVESAVRSKKATAKDQYGRGMQYEAQGDFVSAKQEYFGFIRANKKQTKNGTLAAPYHRLALISWKQQDQDKADVYFRYSLRYAQGGNIPVIAGDYSLFLTDRKKLDHAEAVLRSALLQFPKDKRLLFSLGQCVARQDKTIEAMRYLTEATDEDRAYQEIAILYQQRGEHVLAQNMMRKRDLYLAERNARSHQQQYFVQNRVAVPVQSVPVQPGPPPVMENPRGMVGQATLVHPMPFPMLEDWNGSAVSSQAATAPNGLIDTNKAVPETGDVANPAAPSKSKSDFPPVSKVYHYPMGSPTPVYHQYVGEHYPKTVPSAQGTSGPYYMMSTVPQTPADFQPQGSSAVGQVPPYSPMM